MKFLDLNSQIFYLTTTFISTVVAFFGAIYTSRQRKGSNYTYITILFITSGIWAVMDGLGVAIASYNGKIAVALLAYFGVVFVAPSIFMMSLIQADLLHRAPIGLIKLMWVIAGAYLFFVFTNPMHHLYWSGFVWVDQPIANSLQFLRGPLYNFFPYIYYLLLAASVIILVYSLSYSRGVLQKQTLGLLAAIIIPWSIHIFWLSTDYIANNWDYTSQVMIVSIILMVVNVNHWQLFDLVPIVENEIPNLIDDGIIVVDDIDRIIYHNQAANEILDWGADSKVGTLFRSSDQQHWVEFRTNAGKQKFVSYKRSSVKRAASSRSANILLITDVTQKHLDDERIGKLEQEKLINEQRHIIADDLHDAMAQSLYSLKLLSEEVIRVNTEKKPVDDALAMMTSAIDYAIAEFRMTIFNLQNTGNQTDLEEFIHERLASVEDRVGLETHTDLTSLPKLKPDQIASLTAIISEALNNTLIHAHATSVNVNAFEENGANIIQIVDDGIGFDPKKRIKGHYGLRNMTDRAKKINASVKFESNKGIGSTVTIRFNKGTGK